MSETMTAGRGIRQTGVARPPREHTRDEHRQHHPKENLGNTDRMFNLLAGCGLALWGLERHDLVGLGLMAAGGVMLKRGMTGYCELYDLLGLSTKPRHPAEAEDYYERGIHVEQAFTIMKSPEELYRFWRDFSNLPRFMKHLDRVDVQSETHSHWTAKGPFGRSVSWDAEVIHDEPNRRIAWKTVGDADVDHAGSITFHGRGGAEGGDAGTEVRVVLDYLPPAGRVGSAIAYLFGEEPTIQVKEDLRRFKRLMETGEIISVEGQPRGECK